MAEQPREKVLSCPLEEEPRLNVPAWPLKAKLLEKVSDSPRTSEPLEIILACPLTLVHALISAVRMEVPLENVPACPLTEKTLEKVVLVSPLMLSEDHFLWLGHISLRHLSSSGGLHSPHTCHTYYLMPLYSLLAFWGLFCRTPSCPTWYLSGRNVLPGSLLPSRGRRCVLTILLRCRAEAASPLPHSVYGACQLVVHGGS